MPIFTSVFRNITILGTCANIWARCVKAAMKGSQAFRCSAGISPELSMWPPSPILNFAAASNAMGG